MSEEKKQKQLNVELSDEVGEGIYSNLVMIGHSESEFLLDFVCAMPGLSKAQVKSRIILTPEHAKRFMKALQDNLERYEKMFGEIQERASSVSPDMSGLGTPSAKA